MYWDRNSRRVGVQVEQPFIRTIPAAKYPDEDCTVRLVGFIFLQTMTFKE